MLTPLFNFFHIRRQFITLLELLIVMGILALISGIVTISINKALIDQRFQTEVDLIVNELRLAQDLMLILGTDVHLNFSEAKDGAGIEYWVKLETILPKNIQKEILRERKPLKTIHGVFLEDQLVTEIKEKHIDIKFLSNGAVMSKGVMLLSTSDKESQLKGALSKYICLAGYPRPIISSDTKEEAEKLCNAFEEGLDERLTTDTILRLPERLKKTEKEAAPETSPENAEQKNQQPSQEQNPSKPRSQNKRGAG
jgi:type II secretory pathway pseudopilin PulG